MKQKTKQDLTEKLDGRTFFWFWEKHIKPKVGIAYTTFMNQLSPRNKVSENVDAVITKFLEGK